MPKRMQRGLRAAISKMPGRNIAQKKKALADALGIQVQSINKWDRVPHKRIVDVERITQVPREAMAPELYST